MNFADHCARKGLRTLLVDLGPQTIATFSSMGVDEWDKDTNGTVTDFLELAITQLLTASEKPSQMSW